jgi:hypothetical protein
MYLQQIGTFKIERAGRLMRDGSGERGTGDGLHDGGTVGSGLSCCGSVSDTGSAVEIIIPNPSKRVFLR